MDTDRAIAQRVGLLVAQASDLIEGARQKAAPGYVLAPPEGFARWRAQSLAAIGAIVGEHHVYYEAFVRDVKSSEVVCVEQGRGILAGLRDDLDSGYLRSYRELVTADVFAGFLEVAGYLLEHNYKDAAASITGAVLENGLKEVLAKRGHQVAGRGNLQSLSQQALQKKVVSGLEFKNLQAWIALRDHADHGEFDQYDVGDVKRMIDGVTDFLSKH